MAATLCLLGTVAAAAPGIVAGSAGTGFLDIVRGARVIAVGAGSSEVDGAYNCRPAMTLCFKEEKTDYDIKWYSEAYEKDRMLWPAGWYMERALSKAGIYFMDAGNNTHLPLGTWKVWSGRSSDPGGEPPPMITEVNSIAFQGPVGAAGRPGEEGSARRAISPVLLSSLVFAMAALALCLLVLARRHNAQFTSREVGHLVSSKDDDDTDPE